MNFTRNHVPLKLKHELIQRMRWIIGTGQGPVCSLWFQVKAWKVSGFQVEAWKVSGFQVVAWKISGFQLKA